MRPRGVDTAIAIGGTQIPCKSWQVRVGSDGSIGSVRCETSVLLLKQSGVDVISWSQKPDGASLDVFIGYDQSLSHVFGGVLDDLRWQFNDDLIEITGRDYGAVLADTQSVTSSINYKNATVSDIAQQIADLNGFTANITRTDVKASTEMWQTSAFVPHAQSWWSILQNLAQQVAYELHITPTKELYFGPPISSSSLRCIYVPTRAQVRNRQMEPLKSFEIEYHPRNNANFNVKVISYHPQGATRITGQAQSLDSVNLSGIGTSKPNIGSSVGTTGRRVRNIPRVSGKPSKKPTFTYFMDGLDQNKADSKAKSIADDIAKRTVVINGTIEGNAGVEVHTSIKLVEGRIDLLGFDTLDYRVTSLEHQFSMPQRGSKSGGWTTHFEAMAAIGTL